MVEVVPQGPVAADAVEAAAMASARVEAVEAATVKAAVAVPVL
jgi:hypothetical protein